MSPRSADRLWAYARAWLRREAAPGLSPRLIPDIRKYRFRRPSSRGSHVLGWWVSEVRHEGPAQAGTPTRAHPQLLATKPCGIVVRRVFGKALELQDSRPPWIPPPSSSRGQSSRFDTTARIAAFSLFIWTTAAPAARCQTPPPDSSWMADAVVDKPSNATGTKLGAAQGIAVREGRIYAYGDVYSAQPRVGVIREYDMELKPTGREVWLRKGDRPLITHPTGLTWDERWARFWAIPSRRRPSSIGSTGNGPGTMGTSTRRCSTPSTTTRRSMAAAPRLSPSTGRL